MSVNSVGGPSQSPVSMMGSYQEVSVELGGDTSAQIAALMLVSSHEQRQSLHKARQATEKRVETAERKQVQSMRDQADHIRSAGWIDGVSQIAAGAFEMGGATEALDAGAGGNADAYLTEGKGGSQLTSGAGEMFSSQEKYEGGMADADATAAGHRADAGKRTLDDIRDSEKDARDVARKALDMVENLRDTQSAMNRAALFNRA